MSDKKSQDNIDLQPPSEPTEIIDGLIYYQRADGIVVYRFKKMSRKLVDLYAQLSEYNDQRFLAEKRLLKTMYDGRGMFPTPYFIATAVRLAKATAPEHDEAIAVLTGDNLTSNVFRIVVKKLSPKVQDSIRFFKTEDDAIHWLNEFDTEASSDSNN